MDMLNLVRIFIFIGLFFLLVGGLLYLTTRLGLPLGRLPGDIRWQSENFTCIFPIVTMLLLSLVLTVVLNVVIRLLNR